MILHLVRGVAPAGAIADGDWVVQLAELRLVTPGAPVAPGRIDHDQLVALIAAADRVVTW